MIECDKCLYIIIIANKPTTTTFISNMKYAFEQLVEKVIFMKKFLCSLDDKYYILRKV